MSSVAWSPVTPSENASTPAGPGRPRGYGTGLGGAARMAAAVARRPALWGAALRLVPPRWWSRWPPVPAPSRDYIRFRVETMYGEEGPVGGADLLTYLEWCRRMGRVAR